jgi:hypothetical protein
MGRILDLFGDPVSKNHGRRGRPEHVATAENRRKVNMLLALGWSNPRIAAALRITQPSLRKHYFSELQSRSVARDRLDTKLAMTLWKLVEDGNVSAIKEFRKLLERNDLMTFGQHRPPAIESKPQKLGKKEKARHDAQHPETGTPLGDLMAQRQAAKPN